MECTRPSKHNDLIREYVTSDCLKAGRISTISFSLTSELLDILKKKGLISSVLFSGSLCCHMPSIRSITLLVKIGATQANVCHHLTSFRVTAFLDYTWSETIVAQGGNWWEASFTPVVISDHWLSSHRRHSGHQQLWEAADSRIKTRLGLCRSQSSKAPMASKILCGNLETKEQNSLQCSHYLQKKAFNKRAEMPQTLQ